MKNSISDFDCKICSGCFPAREMATADRCGGCYDSSYHTVENGVDNLAMIDNYVKGELKC